MLVVMPGAMLQWALPLLMVVVPSVELNWPRLMFSALL